MASGLDYFAYDVTMQINASNDSMTTTTIIPGHQPSAFLHFVQQIVVPIIFGIITLLGVLGNTLVIYVIFTRQKMRTVTNLLLLNLAFADLSFVVICPPFTAYQYATNSWPFAGYFGLVLCKLMHYLLNVTVYVTIYTLVLIAIIRYMTVVHNHRTIKVRTRRNIILMIIAIWGIMLLGNVPAILYHGVDNINNVPVCDSKGEEFGKIWFLLFFILAYLLPLLIIAIFSLCILKHIRDNRPSMLETQKNKKSAVRKKKASQLLIMVIAIFAFLWLPIHVHLLWAYWGSIPHSEAYMAISYIFNCMAYCNSCVNPFIYNYASKDFRESFREVVCCIRGHKFADREKSFYVRTEMTSANGGELKTRLKLEEDDSSEEQNGSAV